MVLARTLLPSFAVSEIPVHAELGWKNDKPAAKMTANNLKNFCIVISVVPESTLTLGGLVNRLIVLL